MIRYLLVFMLGLIAALYGVYSAWSTPSPVAAAMTQQQVALAVRAEYHAHLRGLLLQWSLLLLCIGALAAAIYRWLYVPAINARERIPVDSSGMYPELVRDVTPLHKRLSGELKIWRHNPNMSVAPDTYATLNGSMRIEAATDGLSAEQQLQYARDSWSVQRTAAAAHAMARPNVAMMKAAAGVYDWQAERERARAEAIAQRTQPAQIADAGPVEQELTPGQALERSQAGVVYIGQQDTGRRALAAWDTNGASTLGIFGANGTGKTSSVATMVTLAMVRWGWRLWVLDGKDSGDWDEFGGHAEVVPVAQHNIEDAMQAIWEEYQRRETVMSEYRARDYRHLPPDVQAEFPRWGVVFEEFGATRLSLRSKTRAQLDKFLSVLCQKARYTGWHGVFIDQRPSDYTDEMKGNLKSVACFKLLMNQGHAVNAYHAGQLADVGEFEMDGGRYWAFHAEPLARSVLAGVPVRSFGRSVTGGDRTVTPLPLPNAERRTDAPNDETTDLQAAVWSWRDANPNGTQADMRRDFAERGIEIAKSYAHECWHKWPGVPLPDLKDEMTLEELQALGVGLEAIEIDRDKYGAARLYTTNGAH